MDVVLDANIYLSDIPFRKTGFQGLFAYLKRTNHFLVIPDVVYEEVLARYRERLDGAVRKANSHWNNVQHMRSSEGGELPKVDVEKEVESFSKRLNQPTASMKSIRYGRNSAVTTLDVARRGINRIKPADPNGEQLRDVLLWLQVIEYAKSARNGTAFITDNSDDFWAGKDSRRLHPDLQKEIEEQGIALSFYFDTADFLSKNALEMSPVLEAELPPELQLKEISSGMAERLMNTQTRHGFANKIESDKVWFKSAILFKISDDISIMELTYEGEATFGFPNLAGKLIISSDWPSEGVVQMPQNVGDYIAAMGNVAHYVPLTLAKSLTESFGPVETLLKFESVVSARFHNKKLTSWDVESVRFLVS